MHESCWRQVFGAALPATIAVFMLAASAQATAQTAAARPYRKVTLLFLTPFLFVSLAPDERAPFPALADCRRVGQGARHVFVSRCVLAGTDRRG